MTSKRFNVCEVAVIGAGPYGLSVAAHLRHGGISARVFGEPMSFWREHMPKGMRIRSPEHATDLSSPAGEHSFKAYMATQQSRPEWPVPLECFVGYGAWFQQQFIPDVDCRKVRQVERVADGFQLTLADSEVFAAARVVVATGLINQAYYPQVFRDCPPALVTHSSEHADFAPFRGKHVGVIGRGQSACESAALLSEAGASVELIGRGDIHWLGSGEPAASKPFSSRLHDLVAAPSAVGPFPLSWLVEMPAVVRHLPAELRGHIATRCLKAAATGWLKPRFEAVTLNLSRTIAAARPAADRIAVELDNGVRTFDHVVLGTGYHIDIARIGIFAPQLLDDIMCIDGSPVLSTNFESSVPKLHFVGSAAVRSFGPLLRFVSGASYAAPAITRAARSRSGKSRRAPSTR
jgi:FAD-dependent urate hydroxylase